MLYPRSMLLNVKGATSFKEIRTVSFGVFNTFRRACMARGLLGDDLERIPVFSKRFTSNFVPLTNGFATILSNWEPSSPPVLKKNHFSIDIAGILSRCRDIEI